MATDVDVQYFSHLNGLVLGNNWGDLIRLLDKALVTGIDFTQITAASIDAQGDVHITLFAAHNAMLFQVVELSGFTPNSLNQKYRIKGVPGTTKLILKPKDAITVTSISVIGNGKLAPLGYDIIFRDTNDVKRVYRAKNPTAQHPFIRVDESLTSPNGSSGVYSSTYAKFAMVGLLERMDHIDDFNNPNVLQLPFDPNNPAKNWKINGTGGGVVRGWSKWYWATASEVYVDTYETQSPMINNKYFTLAGDKDSFYFLRNLSDQFEYKLMSGCGLFKSSGDTSIDKNYFLMTSLNNQKANTYNGLMVIDGGIPLAGSNALNSSFFISQGLTAKHAVGQPLLYDFSTGYSNIAPDTGVAALEIPILAARKFIGNLSHIFYSGKLTSAVYTTPVLGEQSMYINESLLVSANGVQRGNVYFYLGEL